MTTNIKARITGIHGWKEVNMGGEEEGKVMPGLHCGRKG
jgi:hypothetical protein